MSREGESGLLAELDMVADPSGRLVDLVSVTYWLLLVLALVGDRLSKFSRGVGVSSGTSEKIDPVNIVPEGSTPFEELSAVDGGYAVWGNDAKPEKSVRG